MYEIEAVELAEQSTAVIRDKVAAEELPNWMPGAFSEVGGLLAQAGIKPTGPPFARYLREDGVFEVEAGFPVGSPVIGEGRVEPSWLPAGSAITALHSGPYETLPDTIRALEDWIEGHGHEEAGAYWEVYLTNPNQEPDVSEWHTKVVMPYTPGI